MTQIARWGLKKIEDVDQRLKDNTGCHERVSCAQREKEGRNKARNKKKGLQQPSFELVATPHRATRPCLKNIGTVVCVLAASVKQGRYQGTVYAAN